MNGFLQRKNNIILQLSSGKTDNSPKGYIDAHISDLCHYINTLPTVYTTSSCSGRITIFQHGSETKGGKWLLSTHDFTTDEEVGRSLLKVLTKKDDQEKIACLFSNNNLPADINTSDNKTDTTITPETEPSTPEPPLNVFMRFEAAILCVETYDLETASQFIVIAHETGYRESGITSITSRYVANVRGSLRLDIPIILNGELLVSGEYIKQLVVLSNQYMQTNFDKIAKFWSNLQKHPYFSPEMQNVPLNDILNGTSSHLQQITSNLQEVTQNYHGGQYLLTSRKNILLLKDFLRQKLCTDVEYEVEILPINHVAVLIKDSDENTDDNSIIQKILDGNVDNNATTQYGLFTLNLFAKKLFISLQKSSSDRLITTSFVEILSAIFNTSQEELFDMLKKHHDQIIAKQNKKNKNKESESVSNSKNVTINELIALYDFPIVYVINTFKSTEEANFGQITSTKFFRNNKSNFLNKQEQPSSGRLPTLE